jgi:hypothetical protein
MAKHYLPVFDPASAHTEAVSQLFVLVLVVCAIILLIVLKPRPLCPALPGAAEKNPYAEPGIRAVLAADYFFFAWRFSSMAAWAAASRATGTR